MSSDTSQDCTLDRHLSESVWQCGTCPALWSSALTAHQCLESSPPIAQDALSSLAESPECSLPPFQSTRFVPLLFCLVLKSKCWSLWCSGLSFVWSFCDCMTYLLMLQACIL